MEITEESVKAQTSNTVIQEGIHLEGSVSGGGNLRVGGHIKGHIHIPQSTCYIERTGKVDADILAETVIVDGEVDGPINAKKGVAIREEGKVFGNIITPRLLVKDGARIIGNVKVTGERER